MVEAEGEGLEPHWMNLSLSLLHHGGLGDVLTEHEGPVNVAENHI